MDFSFRQNFNFFKVFLGIKAPIYVQLALSKSCNMRCRMCNVVQSRRDEKQLTLPELERLVDVLKCMGIGFIILTGGEPFLRKDIVEVVKIFKRKHISVRMQSNGLLFTSDLLKHLKYAGLDGITVSLHSLSKEKMAYLTNLPDALSKILEAICLYTEIFPSKNHIRGINTVVSALNIEELPGIVEFVTRIGFTVSLIPVHQAPEEQFIVRGQDENLLFHEKSFSIIDEVYEKLISMKKTGYNIYNSEKFLRQSPDFLKNGKVTWKCESPGLYFSISPSGTFLPCVDLTGNYSMLDQDFLSLWKTKDFKNEIRNQVLKCQGCMYACYPEFSYMLHSKRFFIKRFFEYRNMNTIETSPLTLEKIHKIFKECQNLFYS